jgi:protein-disulfide isomerase
MTGGVLAVPVGPEDHVIGPANAPITLVEYGDYQCPYCGQAYPITQALIQEFGPDLRFVFRNLPLSHVHPRAQAAAEAAEAVGLQGKFWQMHDLLFENQQDLSAAALLEYARQAGADIGSSNLAVLTPLRSQGLDGYAEARSTLRSFSCSWD